MIPIGTRHHGFKTKKNTFVLMWACVVMAGLLGAIYMLQQSFSIKKKFVQTKHTLEAQHQTLLLQKDELITLLKNPEVRHWHQNLSRLYDPLECEKMLHLLAKQHYGSAKISTQATKGSEKNTFPLKTASETFQKNTFYINFSSQSDTDALSFIESLRKTAHNSLVIHSIALERTKGFSDDLFEKALLDSDLFLFETKMEISVVHNGVNPTRFETSLSTNTGPSYNHSNPFFYADKGTE